jgi:pimeloyl-ACP methyl ester carboxylesterase
MKSVRANGIDIAYEDCGSGPPLLLLHGFSLDHTMWAAQVEELQRSYRIIVPDLRGLGKTETPPEPFSIETMADDAAALLEAIDIPAAAVAGFSLGGYTLCQLLARHPLKVRAAAFVSTRAEADTEEGRERRTRIARLVIDEGMAPFATAFIPQLFDPAYLSAHPQEVAQTQSVIESQRPNGIALVLDAMRQRLDMSFYLKDFSQPAAVIGGLADALVPPQAMRDLHEGLPDSTIKLIDGVGHMSPVEAPEEVSFQLDQLMQRAGMWL